MKNFNTLIGIIEFRELGFSYRMTRRRFNVGMGTIDRTLKLFDSFGLSLKELKEMSPKDVEGMFYPQDQIRRKKQELPDFEEYYQRIHMPGSKVNLTFLWYEYKDKNPDGYQLTQFIEHYNRYVRDHYGDRKVTMAVERVPGEKMYIDWMGDQPAVLRTPGSSELQKIHVFTTTMGYSSMVFAECFTDEKADKFIRGVTDAITYYGGVAKYLVPDNLKTAITKNTRDVLVLNSLFKDLESFYDTVVLPPPPRKPRGKASVEAHVSYLETHLVEKLKEEIFSSIDEINFRTREVVEAINGRSAKRESSRLVLFESYDKPALKPLNGARFSPVDYKVVSHIPDNYHIEYDGHYYSVSYTLHSKPAILKATYSQILICDEYNRLQARHNRVYDAFPKYVTKDEHMPKEHLFFRDVNRHDGSFYRSWSRRFGENMAQFIDLLLRKADHEQQAYRSCMGLLHTCGECPRPVVDEAAALCIRCNNVSYSGFMKAIGKVKTEKEQIRELVDDDSDDPVVNLRHKNIRGKENYR